MGRRTGRELVTNPPGRSARRMIKSLPASSTALVICTLPYLSARLTASPLKSNSRRSPEVCGKVADDDEICERVSVNAAMETVAGMEDVMAAWNVAAVERKGAEGGGAGISGFCSITAGCLFPISVF